MPKKTRRHWTEEEKAKILAQLSSKSSAEVAEENGIGRHQIYKWAKAAGLSVSEITSGGEPESAAQRKRPPLQLKRAYITEALASTAKAVEDKYGLSYGSIVRWKAAGVKPLRASGTKTMASNGAARAAVSEEAPVSQPPPSIGGAMNEIERQLQSALAQLKAIRQTFAAVFGS